MLNRIINYKFKEADLRKVSQEELDVMKEWIRKEESRRNIWEELEVAVDAINTGHEYFKAVGIAMLHLINVKAKTLKPHQWSEIVNRTEIQLPSDFSVKEHAYHLADVSYKFCNKLENTELIKRIKKFFEEEDFIFQWTHYDECDNGFYRRRS